MIKANAASAYIVDEFRKKKENAQIVRKLFYNVVFIVILSNLVGALTSFTDGICASRLINDAASAALAIISPLITFVSIFGAILQIGTQIAASRRLAQGNIKDARKVFSTSVTVCVVGSVVMAIIIISICLFTNVLYDLGGDATSVQYAFWYVLGFFIGLPFFICYSVLLQIVNLVNGKKYSNISIIAVLVVNVIGDVISGVLYRFGPFEQNVGNGKWAILGIALATTFSFVAGVIILSIAFHKKDSVLKFSISDISASIMKEIILIGLPAGAKVIFIFIRTSTVNVLFNNAQVLHSGISYSAQVLFTALSAQGHISPFVESVTGGLIATTLSLSSIFYSEEDEDSLNELLRLVFRITFIVVVGLSIIYVLMAQPLVKLYGVGETTIDDPSPEAKILAATMVEQSQLALVYDALALPFVAINASMLAFFQGTRRTNYAYAITCIQSLILPLATLTIFTFFFDFMGNVWFGLSMGYVTYSFVHLIYAFINAKVHHRKFHLDARTLFFLRDDFGYKDDQYLRVKVTGIANAMELPNQIIEFCNYHKVDKQRAHQLATCAEELAKSIVISGFTLDKKKHHICEVRVLYKNNQLVLRIRDDCELYSLQERAKRVEIKDDPAANVSLRIIYKHAKSIKYSNLLKTNNLVITV